MAESKVNRDNYIVVQGWMLTDLKLKGNELLIYACIYGFSQAEKQKFTGSLRYLADWTNSTKQGVIKCLKQLEEKGYIIKNETFINGVKFCEYYATELTTVLNKVGQGGKQSSMGGSQQSLPNNQEINNLSESAIGKSIGKATNRFTPPTLAEVQAYCKERGNNVDAERFIDYYTSNGWKVGKNKMRDWKAAVRTWEKSSNKPAATPKQGGGNGNIFLDIAHDEGLL